MSDDLIQDLDALTAYIDELENRIGKMASALHELEDDTRKLRIKWQDHEFYEFERHVHGVVEEIEENIRGLQKQSEALKLQASDLRDYKNVKS